MLGFPLHQRIARDLAIVLCCAAGIAAAADPALPPAGVPQSVGVQLKSPNFKIDTLNAARDMGFRVFRRGIYWDAAETEKGKYDFSSWDAQFNHAKQNGIRVVACLFGNNKLHEDDDRGGVQTEAGRAGFAAFAAAAAAHYKDHNLLWEIWNEPNVRTFWRKDGMHNSEEFAQEYADLVNTVTPAMLKADPNAFVMAGSVSNYWKPSYEWTEACFKKGVLRSGIRGWSVHPYGVQTPEEFAIGHGITRTLLKQYGAPDLPIVNTERGFAIKKPRTELELEGWSGGSESEVRNYQAAHFVRQFMADQLAGVALTIWYEWDGEEFGIIGKEGQRPVELAARTMVRQLDGYRLEKRIATENPLDYLLVWKNAEGKQQLVAWTAPPAGGTPDESRPHQVAIEVAGGGTFEITDLTGKVTQADALKLNLSGLPQYVRLPANTQLGKVTTSAPAPSANQAAPAQGTDLAMFADAEKWKFMKNTGDGSFSVKTEGNDAIGVLQYDFTKSAAKGTPYVLAERELKIEAGDAISFRARSNTPQSLTFRIVDSSDQTHQMKLRLQGTGQWETVRIPLNRKLEHWGGNNDGKVQFPVARIVFSVPQPREDHKVGIVEYANGVLVSSAAAPK